jgi:hypothetical protein
MRCAQFHSNLFLWKLCKAKKVIYSKENNNQKYVLVCNQIKSNRTQILDSII